MMVVTPVMDQMWNQVVFVMGLMWNLVAAVKVLD